MVKHQKETASGSWFTTLTSSGLPTVAVHLVLLMVLASLVLPVRAQTDGWSQPIMFFDPGPDGQTHTPRLVLDSNGILHALWPVRPSADEPAAIYYSRWTGDRWLDPVDILYSPEGVGILGISTVEDQTGRLRAFWNWFDGFRSSWAYYSEMGNPQAWSSPTSILLDEIPYASPSVVLLGTDHLLLTYVPNSYKAVTVLESTDGGATWSEPRDIYAETSHERGVSSPGMMVAPNGDLYAWWSQVQLPSGTPQGVAYSVSTDGGGSWSPPEELAGGEAFRYFESSNWYYSGGFRRLNTTLVRIAAGGAGVGRRYISLSDDNGRTWTEPVNIGAGGVEGMQGVGIAVDSRDIWHFIEQTDGTFATVTWDGHTWSAPQLILTSEELVAICQDRPGDIENATMAISEGNRMHVFWEGPGDGSIWYTSRLLDAPYVPPQPWPTPSTPDLAHTPELVEAPATETPTPSRPDDSILSAPASSSTSRSSWPLVAGMLPALLLIVVVVVIRISLTRRG